VYTVSLTNNDNPGCSASSFDLTVTYLPSGWIGDLSTNLLSLVPGATGTAILSLTPANDSADHSHNLQVAVSDAREPTHAKAATATYRPMTQPRSSIMSWHRLCRRNLSLAKPAPVNRPRTPTQRTSRRPATGCAR
jgi:hypothetical protein